ncbi:peptidylprolyl isomerase, partial [Vibrio sp. M260118]
DFISELDAPELLKTPAVLQAIVSPEVKEDGLNSEVIEVAPEHVIVVRVEDTRDETVLPLEEVRSQVTKTLASVKGEQRAIELADALVADLKQGKQELLEQNGLAFGEVETVDRSSPLADVVFSMVKPAEGQVEYAQAKDLSGDIVVVELSSVSAVFNTMYNEQIAQQMTQSNAQQDLSGLISILRKTIDIEYFVVTQ